METKKLLKYKDARNKKKSIKKLVTIVSRFYNFCV